MRKKQRNILILFFLLIAGACTKKNVEVTQTEVIPPKEVGGTTLTGSFRHPGIAFSSYDLERMKANRTVAPWSTGYNLLASSAQGSLNYTMMGPYATVGREPNLNLTQYESDAKAVLYQAIQFYVTGNSAYAAKALQILNAWTTTHTSWSGGTPFLAASDYGLNFIIGAEILRYNYTGWNSAATTNCESYFANMLWPLFGVSENSELRAANQGAAQLKGAIAVAVFNNDATKFNQVLDAWHNNACGGLAGTTLASGQNADSGRDQAHALGLIGNFAFVAETAWKQNIDLFGELDNRILATMEYFAKYNLNNSVPFTPFGACYGYYTSMGSGQGAWNWPVVYELIYGAYAIRKGIPAPFTDQYRNSMGATAETFLYRKDGATPPTPPAAPPASLAPAVPPIMNAVTNLTGLDIGAVGVSGSTAFANGTWTIKGSGKDIYNTIDAFHFAYREISGDVVLITKVASIQNTYAWAKAGLMIRESLSPNSRHATIYMEPGNAGAEFFRRNVLGGPAVDLQKHDTAGPVPYWLKMVRKGNMITAYHSFNGLIWTPMRSVNLAMDAKVYVGLVVCAIDNTVLNTSTFTDFSIGLGG
ncbi:DUF1349 domain-containing protein [Pedobacter frigidisoli]|uniref:DUF1349 domain-containing protein n=1 Tax=Pedobacter frigidisoli TaxID=2530455 RepID=UPI00292DD695|nr:DUF1349 domain-containing protein [Pedobacter frigidisoli]